MKSLLNKQTILIGKITRHTASDNKCFSSSENREMEWRTANLYGRQWGSSIYRSNSASCTKDSSDNKHAMLELSTDQKILIKTPKSVVWKPNHLQHVTVVAMLEQVKQQYGSSRASSQSAPKLKIAFCSYTGTIPKVLRTKLLAQKQIYIKSDFIGYDSSLFYSTIEDDRGRILGFKLKIK